MSFLQLTNVDLAFKQQKIFSQFSLSLAAGEKLALLGASGIGKSSLLKLLCGIYQPDSGKIENNAQRIGYIFQEARLLPWLTVEQNIAQVLIPYKLPTEEVSKRVSRMLSEVNLAEFSQYYPHQLSGGMAQRVSLARAFAIEPDLLLLDEPLSALDPALRRQLSGFIQRYVLEHKPTLIYVSHNPEDALPLVDKCLLLAKNKTPQAICIAEQQDIDNIIHQFNHREEH